MAGTAGTPTRPRGEESLVVVGEAEKDNNGRRTTGLCGAVKCSGLPDAPVSQGGQGYISMTSCGRVLIAVSLPDSGC